MAGIQDIRKGLTGTTSKIIVGLIIITFSLFFGWGTVFSSSETNVIAKVNGKNLDIYDLDFEIRTQQFYLNQLNQNENEINDDLLKDLSMKSLVRRASILDFVEGQGAEVTDLFAYQELAKDENFLDGGNFNQRRFESVVRSLGFIPSKFLERTKEDILLRFWQQGIGDSLFITNKELEDSLILANQTRDITFIKLPFSRFKDSVTLDSEAIRKYYEENSSWFLTEPRAKVNYIEISSDNLKEDVFISDQELKEEYDSYLENLDLSIRRSASHLMIKAGNFRSKEEALSFISDLRNKILLGENFSDLVKEFSEDEGTKLSGGALGISDGSIFPEVFESAILNMKKNEISEPIFLSESNSYHLIKLTEINNPFAETFELMAPRLKTNLKNNFVNTKYLDLLDKAADEVYLSGSLMVLGEKLNLPINETEFSTRDQLDNALQDEAIQELIFSNENIQSGSLSEVVEVSETKAIILQVEDYRGEKLKSFEEVSDLAEERLSNEIAKENIVIKSKDIISALESDLKLDFLATKDNLKIETYRGVTRNSSLLPRRVLSKLFNLPRSSKKLSSYVLLSSGDSIVFSLDQVNEAEPSQNVEELDLYKEFLSNERKVSELSELQVKLEEYAEVVVNRSN